MSRAVILALLVAACGKPSPEKACQHAMALRSAAMDRQIQHTRYSGSTDLQASVVVMKKELAARRDEDVAKCMVAVAAKDLDTGCMADAGSLDQLVEECFDGGKRNLAAFE
jgi:hypothetical protein